MGDGFNFRILVVDDEETIRSTSAKVLETKGFEVRTAADGFAALVELRRSPPDILISDLRMPNMNGFELLAVVREKFPQLPVIAISGEFVGEQVEGILADVFLQKGSYTPETLLEVIDSLFRRTTTARRRDSATVWAATKDVEVLITCSECLRSCPLDPCEPAEQQSKEVRCIFCDARLQYRLIAITKAV